MQRDDPDLGEILRTVREFVAGITDTLAEQERYHAMCASYLLSVGLRELELGPAVDRAERATLAAFYGATGADAAGIAGLSRDIRAGRCDARWDETLALVLAHVVNKVRVSRPEHLAELHREAGPAGSETASGGDTE